MPPPCPRVDTPNRESGRFAMGSDRARSSPVVSPETALNLKHPLGVALTVGRFAEVLPLCGPGVVAKSGAAISIALSIPDTARQHWHQQQAAPVPALGALSTEP